MNPSDRDLTVENLNSCRKVFRFGNRRSASERRHIHVERQVLFEANLPPYVDRLSVPEIAQLDPRAIPHRHLRVKVQGADLLVQVENIGFWVLRQVSWLNPSTEL